MQAEPDIVGFPVLPKPIGWSKLIDTEVAIKSLAIVIVFDVWKNNSDCATTIPIGISAIVAIAIMIFLFLDILFVI